MKDKQNINPSMQEEIKEILHCEWDPIGIQGVREAYDEYDNYISPIHIMLVSGKTEDEIYSYLNWLGNEYMKVLLDPCKTKRVAHILFELGEKRKRVDK